MRRRSRAGCRGPSWNARTFSAQLDAPGWVDAQRARVTRESALRDRIDVCSQRGLAGFGLHRTQLFRRVVLRVALEAQPGAELGALVVAHLAERGEAHGDLAGGRLEVDRDAILRAQVGLEGEFGIDGGEHAGRVDTSV